MEESGVGELDDGPEPEVQLDLHAIRDLLDLLTEKRVQSFQGLGLTFVFKDDDEYTSFTKSPAKPEAQETDDGHSTSNKRVDGFRNPALYPWQNGKVLKLDGSLE